MTLETKLREWMETAKKATPAHWAISWSSWPGGEGTSYLNWHKNMPTLDAGGGASMTGEQLVGNKQLSGALGPEHPLYSYIATFDPTTVLKLIEACIKMRRTIKNVEEADKRLGHDQKSCLLRHEYYESLRHTLAAVEAMFGGKI